MNNMKLFNKIMKTYYHLQMNIYSNIWSTQILRHAATVRQLSNWTNGDDLYIHIATVNIIQTVNSPV